MHPFYFRLLSLNMEFKITDQVMVIENQLPATVVAVTENFIMVEFEDGNEFGYNPDQLTPLLVKHS